MNLELNGKEIEIDMLDADTLENYDKALKPFIEKIKLNGENPVLYVKSFCQASYDFFDTLLGEGTAQKIFEGKKNMKVCNECLQKCISACVNYLKQGFAKDADEIINSWQDFLS